MKNVIIFDAKNLSNVLVSTLEKHSGLLSKDWKIEIDEIISDLQIKGYEASEIEFTETLRNFSFNSNSFYYWSYLTATTQHSTITKSDSLTLYYTSSDYTKNRNISGAALQTEVEVIRKNEADKSAFEAEKARIKAENLAKEKQDKINQAELELMAWAGLHGSELLKERIDLGFEYDCLLKTEYDKYVFGDSILKACEQSSIDECKKPSLNLMKIFRDFNSTFEGKFKNATLDMAQYRNGGQFQYYIWFRSNTGSEYYLPIEA